MSKNSNLIGLIILTALAGLTTQAFAQTTFSGKVTDKKGEPIPGANIFLADTYDGTTSDLEGNYQFETYEEGDGVLTVTFIGYHEIMQPVTLNGAQVDLHFEMAEQINKLDAIVISAGAFEASEEKRSVVLKPVDIATTAGATADIPGALNTLPGTQTVGESGRLFVRGGTGEETKVFVDGMLVQQFYTPSAPNTPGRSRFSPFLFKGTSFSTGGYSAEYGQALSSTLSLNSIDLPDETESNISLMTVGGDVSHTHRWENSSLFAQTAYINVAPYIGLVDQAFDFEKAYSSVDGILSYRHKTKKGGMVKLFGNFNTAGFRVNQPNVNDLDQPNHTDLNNDYYFLNGTYKDVLNDKWTHRSGFSFTLSNQDVIFNDTEVDDQERGFHLKSVFERDHSEHVTLRTGAEIINNRFRRDLTEPTFDFNDHFYDNLISVFSEADIYLSSKFILRTGLRSEFSSYLNETNLTPRVSLAYKTSEYGQVSAAFGQYYQSPQNDRLVINAELDFEKSTHYILNYQVIKNDRVFRVEGYYKDYENLLKYDSADPFNPDLFSTNGRGHAQGVDVFWRDNKTLRNVDYWISYSFLDTRRDFRDFPTEAVPTFASRHNFSAVYKHFVQSIRTQLGATYSFTSGRPYHNPNQEGFNQGRVPNYHDLSFNAAFLYKQNVIFYTSITNLTGRDNIFGYEYANSRNPQGRFDRIAIGQPAKRFYFLGVFITLSKNKQKNQLENL